MSKMTGVLTAGSISRCNVRGCREDGLWKPVVLAPYADKKAEAEIGLHICTHHKKYLGDEYFKVLIEEVIVRQVPTHLKPPSLSDMSVRWDKWNPGIIIVDA